MKNDKIQVRKIVLLSLIGLLILTLICQLAVKGSNQAYNLSLKGEIDAISIKNQNETITLAVKDGIWYLSKGQEANENAVKIMTDFLKKIPVLGVVSHNPDDDRYGLDISAIEVKAMRKGKTVRTLQIGKSSATNQQVYCRIDGKKEVVLVGSNPRNIFDHLEAELIQK